MSTPQTIFSIVETKLPETPVKAKRNSILQWCVINWKAIAAEFVATTSLLLFGCMGQCKLDSNVETPALLGALGFGTVVAMNIQMFGHISGAHMNPSVSLGAVLFGSMSVSVMLAYVVAQIAGAVLGYGLLTILATEASIPDAMCSTLPRADLTAVQAVAIEFVLTAALNFVNCGVWDPRNKHLQDSVPIKFGLVITGLSIAGAPLTSASMNPARTLGPAVWNNTWRGHWIYWVGPLLGGSIAVALYRFIWKPDVPNDSPEIQLLEKQY